MNDNTTKTDGRVHIDVDWSDWNGTLPVTSDADELAKAIDGEIADLVKEGIYPEGLRFEKHIAGGLIEGRHPALIEVSAPDSATIFKFYTAYCGGDERQAADELSEAQYEGFDTSVLPSEYR